MVVVIMGVSGCGKTTVGKALAQSLGWAFFDADDFHPPQNIAKMSRGEPLSETDRMPWLEGLRKKVDQINSDGQHAILACSALRKSHRALLGVDQSNVILIYLKGTYEQIAARLASRRGHFMPATLLASQFQAIEEPKEAIVIDITGDTATLVTELRKKLGA